MNPLIEVGWRFLLWYSIASTVLLLSGAIGVARFQAPVERIRLVVVTITACLLAPGLLLVPGRPHWSVPVWIAFESPANNQASLPDLGKPDFTTHAEIRGVPEDQAIEVLTAKPATTFTANGSRAVAWGWGGDARGLILAGYLAGAIGWVLLWGTGQGVLWTLIQSSQPAPVEVQILLRTIAGPAGDRVRLLASDRVGSPVTFTWVRPTILIPTRMARATNPKVLCALAHEWSHIERRDYASWILVATAGVLLYWHPLYWFLRRQLRMNQDFLADDRAGAVASPLAFAAQLVELARTRRRSSGYFPLTSLGVQGRSSQLFRRITMLIADRPALATRCRRTWTGCVSAAALTLLLGVSSVPIDAAARPATSSPRPSETQDPVEPATSTGPNQIAPPDDPRPGREWTGRVRDQRTGRPIEGAEIRIKPSAGRAHPPGRWPPIVATTDAEGIYRFRVAPAVAAEPALYLFFEVEAANYILLTSGYSYASVLKNSELGERPTFEAVGLMPGAAVEGLVLTPDGTPAAGVRVTGYSSPRDRGPFMTGDHLTDTQTDASGRFRILLHDEGRACFRISPEQAAPMTRILAHNQRGDCGTIRLRPGIRLQGRVIDVAGQPVGGIYVMAGPPLTSNPTDLPVAEDTYRTATTNDEGTFTFGPLPPGKIELLPNDRSHDLATRVWYHP